MIAHAQAKTLCPSNKRRHTTHTREEENQKPTKGLPINRHLNQPARRKSILAWKYIVFIYIYIYVYILKVKKKKGGGAEFELIINKITLKKFEWWKPNKTKQKMCKEHKSNTENKQNQSFCLFDKRWDEIRVWLREGPTLKLKKALPVSSRYLVWETYTYRIVRAYLVCLKR